MIADLSVHHVEGLVLRAGFTMQRTQADYGYDLTIDLYNERGEPENEFIRAQLKASDGLDKYAAAREAVYSFPVSVKDYRLWARTLLPALLILYDARIGEAYYLDVQEYAASQPPPQGKMVRLPVPRHNVLGVQTFWLLRERAQGLVRGYLQHMRRVK